MSDNIDMQDIPGTLSASSSTSSQLDLEKVDLSEMKKNMESASASRNWLQVLQEDTIDSWQTLLQQVVCRLTSELAKTTLSDKVIKPLDLHRWSAMMGGFDEEVLKQWKDATRMGVEQGDWTGLINLTKCKKVRNIALGVPMKLKDAVISAWNQDYHGNAHQILLNAIDDLHSCPADQHYVRIMLIAQSSGMGKSKTVDRIGQDRILFPMCLREDLGENVFAYPLSDTVVRDHFLLAPSTRDEQACKNYLNTFLSSLFAQAHAESLELFSDAISYKEMAMIFYDFFADSEQRCTFYEEVITKAKKKDTSKNVKKIFEQLRKRLKKCCTNWPTTFCPLLISLDEVHVLYNPRSVDSGTDYTLYSRFSSVLSRLVDCSFVVMSMSTASHIPSLAPPPAIAPSMRERADNLFRPAPFTELPFDVYIIANPLVPGKETLASIGSLEFTARFGRPLFYATYLSRNEDKNENNLAKEIISVIQEKLSGRPWPPEAHADLDVSSVAILSARLLLDLSPAAVRAKPYEVELVRNHLRILYSVHENRITLVTGSSPEPLIAEASAQIMHYSFQNKKFINLWDLLLKFIDHGLADQGAIGELIGRTLSISAMDHAINSLQATNIRELKFQSPVTVTQYYKALLTDEAWKKLRTSVPANRKQLTAASGKKTFEDAFNNAYFHFSHYGKANDASPIHDSCSWAYWLRGTAIACQLNQELTDRMTPIYFPDQGKVGPEAMSANLDQDKTGQSVNPLSIAIQSAEDLSIFSQDKKLPYIAAVHCYALTVDNDEGIRVSNPEHDCRFKEIDEVAPRYQIDFCGLSAYANITDADKVMIQAMIDHTKSYVFNKHPRSYGISSVRQMLPVLAKDADSTKWFGGYNRASSTAPTLDHKHKHKRGEKRKQAMEVEDLADSDGDNSNSNSNVRFGKRSKKLQHGKSSSKSGSGPSMRSGQ